MDSPPEPISSELLADEDLVSQPESKPKKKDRRKSKRPDTEDTEMEGNTASTVISTREKTTSKVSKRKRKHEEINSMVEDANAIFQTQHSERDTQSQHESKRIRHKSKQQAGRGTYQVDDDQIEGNGPLESNGIDVQDKLEEQDKHNLSSKSSRKKRKQQHKNESTWKSSEAIGGLFADLPPIFSADEEHLLLAQARSVKIYATATSMLVRTCNPGGRGISSFCLSAQDPQKLYILLDNGCVQLWDWTTGRKLKSWDFQTKIASIAVSTTHDATDASDVIFTSETRKRTTYIKAYHLNEHERTELGILYEVDSPIRAIKTLDHAQYIVAITSNSVIVGSRNQDESHKIERSQYNFHKFKAPEGITCFDARINTTTSGKKTGNGGVDIVVGLEDGSLRIYSDAAPKIDKLKDKSKYATPANIKAHWHRQAVGSVAWAPDGNYVISGGQETVLILWQLDTNTQTKIPHLTSAIESIAVSSRGSSYAIRLADNSIMIVGTQDFTPTFHVAGFGVPSTQHHSDKSLAQRLPTRKMPVTSISAQPPRLLSAVPSDMPRSHLGKEQGLGISNNTSLQSTILSSVGAAVTKQALVENNSTTIRKRPDGYQLVSPNVVLLAADHSGTWLATVDEWYQPLNDILPSSEEPGEASKTQLASVLINIVFWLWNQETNSWDSSTRISSPHADDNGLSQSNPLVLDLIAAPGANVFWTLGADSRLKCWAPRKKGRLGSRAASAGSRQTGSVWRCTKIINVPFAGEDVRDVIPSGRVVMTKDASVFAASRMTSKGSEATVFTLHSDGTARQVFTFSLQHQSVSIAFLNQWFIIADSESVLVRNLTDSARWYNAALGSLAAVADGVAAPHLAIDDARQVFAVSVAQKKSHSTHAASGESKILIFSTTSDIPIATFDHQPDSAALLSVPSTNKFYVLTTGAEIYSVSRGLNESTNAVLDRGGSQETNEIPADDKASNTLSKIFGTLEADAVRTDEEESALETESLRRKIAWNDIPGLNLDQPFALPKTSAIQYLSTLAIGA